MDVQNPLIFNVLQTISPMNGLVGVDFEQPKMRVDWWTNTLADLGKFGPSTWTPINILTALSLQKRGEDEAGELA